MTIDGKEYPCGIRLSADDNEFVKASGLYSSCTVGVCCDSSHDAMVKNYAATYYSSRISIFLLLSYEFLLFLSFRIPPIARSTTLRHETINKSGT